MADGTVTDDTRGKQEEKDEKMTSKFLVNIGGGSGSIFMGDNARVDIRDAGGRGSGQHRSTINTITPGDPGFVVHNRPVPATSVHGQATQSGNSVTYMIKQGFALIIHNRIFPKRDLHEREGSEKDVQAIKEFCKLAGFHINDTDRETENLSATEMDALCSEVAKRSFSRYDAFACFILSHGCENGIYGVDDNTISLQEIVSKFNECESLAGKPKLFFIQACRGTNKDSGKIVQPDSHPVNRPIPLRLPSESDILIAHSAADGFESYRSRESGSWFIITLMEELSKHAHEMHLMDILTLVNRGITGYHTPEGYKQMPCQMTTLTKFIYFKYPPPLTSP